MTGWPRGCIRCMAPKAQEAFPLGRSATDPNKSTHHERVCWSCKEECAKEMDGTIRTWIENGVRVVRCKLCNEPKPIGEYSIERKRDETVQRLTCKSCVCAQKRAVWHRTMHGPDGVAQRARHAAGRRKEREAHPERERETRRRAYRERMADPSYRAEVAEKARLAYRLRREREGKPATRSYRNVVFVPTVPIPSLPVLPLRETVEAARNENESERDYASRLQVDSTIFRRWRRGEVDTVTFDVADRICTNLGFGMWEIWPELDQQAA